MKKTTQRIASFLLVLMLLIGLIPSVYATEINIDTGQDSETSETVSETTEPEATEGSEDNEEDTDSTGFPESGVYDFTYTRLSKLRSSETIKLHYYGNYQLQCINYPDKFSATYTTANNVKRSIKLGTLTRMYAGTDRESDEFAYCIEPGTTVKNDTSYDETDAHTAWEDYLSEKQREAVGYLLYVGLNQNTRSTMLSNCKASSSDTGYGVYKEWGATTTSEIENWQLSELYGATQLIAWEIIMGYRSPTAPFTRTSSALLDAYYDVSDSEHSWPTFIKAYNYIVEKLIAAATLPSFMSKYASSAQTATLKYSNGSYSVTLTDTNKVLANYKFTTTASGVTLKTSGNTLTITATAAGAAALASGAATIKCEGTAIDLDSESAIAVWGCNDDTYGDTLQTVVSLTNSADGADPMIGYMKLTAEAFGSIKFTKIAVNGSAAGWQINLYSDASCTALVGTYTTGSDGTVTVSNLTPGTYYAKEVASTSEYWVSDSSTKTITVTAGSTAQASFTNTQYGKIQFTKTAVNGSAAGWQINLYSDASCTALVGTYTTGSDGTVTTGLLSPGTYYARETASSSEYWVSDSSTKTITVTAGSTAQASFTNTQYGKIRFIKYAVNGSAAGWQINLYSDASCTALVGTYTTGSDGTVTTGLLSPGTYYAKEVASPSEYWVSDSSTKTITVTAGSTAQASFTNTQYGKAKITKSLTTDGSVAGWQFKITNDSGAEIDGSPFTTGADGTFTTGLLLPGTYVVEEIIPEDSLYYCKSDNPQTITITAGQTTQVSFVNELIPAKITVYKHDTDGNAMAGVQFCLEWSDDGGTTWNPVSYSAAGPVIKGGCSSANLENGCLTTDSLGYAVFSNLYPGIQYRVTETTTLSNSTLLTDYVFVGELPCNVNGTRSFEIALNVTNSPIIELPETGSTEMFVVAVGPIIMAIALVCLMALSTSTVFTSDPTVKKIKRKDMIHK